MSPNLPEEQFEYEIEFYQEEGGGAPALRWLKEELSPVLRRLMGAAIREVLQREGANVCASEFGRQLGGGLFEFRVGGDPQPHIAAGRKMRGKAPKQVDAPDEKVLLRLFCHAYGKRIVLLLGGYDKAKDPSARRQNDEISEARGRLSRWKDSARRSAKAAK